MQMWKEIKNFVFLLNKILLSVSSLLKWGRGAYLNGQHQAKTYFGAYAYETAQA